MTTLHDYRTIDIGETTTAIEVEKSRFVAYAYRLDDPEKVTEYLQELRRTQPGISHMCYAYTIDSIQKCCDDGEPAGTAGVPILQAIQQAGFDHVLVVVTRYFGGIKLGTGRLARAYAEVTQKVLKIAFHYHMRVCSVARMVFTYQQFNVIEMFIQNESQLLHVDFKKEVTAEVAKPVAEFPELIDRLTKVLHQKPRFTMLEEQIISFLETNVFAPLKIWQSTIKMQSTDAYWWLWKSCG